MPGGLLIGRFPLPRVHYYGCPKYIRTSTIIAAGHGSTFRYLFALLFIKKMASSEQLQTPCCGYPITTSASRSR